MAHFAEASSLDSVVTICSDWLQHRGFLVFFKPALYLLTVHF